MKLTNLAILTTVLATSLLNAVEGEIQVVGGKNFVDRDKTSVYNDANTLGVRTNVFVNTNNGIQLAYDRLKDVNGTKDYHRYSINYIHEQKDNNSNVHPFLLLGAGYEDGDENQAFFNAGVGATVEISKNVNLVAEIKGIRKHNNDVDINTNLGLGLKIGNEPINNETVVYKDDNCLAEKYVQKVVVKEPVNEEINFPDEKVKCVR